MAISIDDQIKCARRELTMRHKVYPAWVKKGKMTDDKAVYEIAAMAAILTTLEGVRRLETDLFIYNVRDYIE